MNERILNVEGMSCNHCKSAVESAVSEVAGVTSVDASPEQDTVTVKYQDDVNMEAVERAIYDAGYDVVKA